MRCYESLRARRAGSFTHSTKLFGLPSGEQTLLHLETVRSRVDNGVARVFRVRVWIRIADVFQRHPLAHDCAFEITRGEDVLCDDFTFVDEGFVRCIFLFRLEQLGMVFHALQQFVSFLTEGLCRDDCGFFS